MITKVLGGCFVLRVKIPFDGLFTSRLATSKGTPFAFVLFMYGDLGLVECVDWCSPFALRARFDRYFM